MGVTHGVILLPEKQKALSIAAMTEVTLIVLKGRVSLVHVQIHAAFCVV